MIVNEKNIKFWSNLGTRATLGLSILDIVKENENLIVVTCDVSTSAGLDRFRKTHPSNYVDVGIAEQNMIGVATGLASEKFDVITTTFSPFQTLRCCEQIKVNLGYMKEKITMVGLASGLVLGNLGYTHCSIEDVGVLRSIPNLKIICPSDTLETIKALKASIEDNTSCYIRLTGGSNTPIINTQDYDFSIGKAIKLMEGKDVIIIGCGVILNEGLQAAEKLKKHNLSTSVINCHTIKPLDQNLLNFIKSTHKILVTIEEHNTIGGLGSAVSELITQNKTTCPLLRIGVDDKYSNSGSYEFLKNHYGLTSDKIVDKILKNI